MKDMIRGVSHTPSGPCLSLWVVLLAPSGSALPSLSALLPLFSLSLFTVAGYLSLNLCQYQSGRLTRNHAPHPHPPNPPRTLPASCLQTFFFVPDLSNNPIAFFRNVRPKVPTVDTSALISIIRPDQTQKATRSSQLAVSLRLPLAERSSESVSK
jgi:hypothetical protein